MTPLNLDRLQHWIDRGLIDPTKPITMRELYETRCVHGVKEGVKLLGDVRLALLRFLDACSSNFDLAKIGVRAFQHPEFADNSLAGIS